MSTRDPSAFDYRLLAIQLEQVKSSDSLETVFKNTQHFV